MKTFILLSLLSLSAQAADYSCLAGRNKYELTTGAETYLLTIKNFQTREILYFGAAGEVIQEDEFSDLIFDVNSHQSIVLRFKTQALKEEVTVLYGLSQGYLGMSAFKCYKSGNGPRP